MLAARVATAAALLAGLLGALFLLPAALLTALVAMLLALAAHEWARLCKYRRWSALLYASSVVAVFGLSVVAGVDLAVLALAAAFWVFAVPFWLVRGVRSSDTAALAFAGFMLLVPAGLAVVLLRPAQVLLLLGVTWVADTAAYFAGRRYGRRKLAPGISPGKTWEGAAGGLLGVLLYAMISPALMPQLGELVKGPAWVPYLAFAVLLCAASIIGDLFESATKRQAGVKDSGNLLPGHGGVLDRVDSATSVLPLAALLWLLFLGK